MGSFSGCTQEDTSSCTYTPEDLATPVCYELSSLEQDTLKKACDGFPGEYKLESCSTTDQLFHCSAVTVVSDKVGVGGVTYIMYSPGTEAAAKTYCENTLKGTFSVIN